MQPGWLKQYFHQHVDPQHVDVSRRDFVKSGFVAGVAAGVAAGAAGSAEQAEAQTYIYPLGRVLEKGIPLFGERLGAHVVLPGTPTGGPFGNHKLYYHDELFVGEIGQIGSQFDGLGHIGMVAADGKIRYYNGYPQEEVGTAYGIKKVGIEELRPFFTRGILLDVLAVKGGERLPIGYVITMDDVQQTLRRQGIREPGEGDAVLFRTGHGKLWKKDNAEFNKGCPGPGDTVGRWLVDKKVCVVGGD